MIQVHAGGVKLTILNMRNLGVSVRKASRAVAAGMGRKYKSAVRNNMSLRDHSLRDLAALDHPYAKRHGSIRIHTGGSNPTITDSTSQVHSRSGAMLRALQGRTSNTTNGARYDLQLNTGIAPHAAFVVLGTRIMHARDPLWDTAMAPAVRLEMMKEAVRQLGLINRTQSLVRFGGL